MLKMWQIKYLIKFLINQLPIMLYVIQLSGVVGAS